MSKLVGGAILALLAALALPGWAAERVAAGGGQAASGIEQAYAVGAISGQRQRIGFYYSVNADCSSAGYAAVEGKQLPSHGRIEITQGEEYPTFAADNQRYNCNRHRTKGMLVYYTSTPGYIGIDIVKLSVVYPNGHIQLWTIPITVE